MTDFWLRDSLYRDTRNAQLKLYHDGKKCAPDFASLAGARHTLLPDRERSPGKHLDTIGSVGMRRVTQPPHIAGPLAFIDNNLRDSKGHFYNDLSNVTTPSQS